MASTEELLVAAKNLIISPENWLQAEASNGKGGYCIIGALQAAGGDSSFITGLQAENCLRNVICQSIVDFNDAPGRTHKEVLDAFDTAIKQSK